MKSEKLVRLNAITSLHYNAEQEKAQNVVGMRIAEARKAKKISLATLRDQLKEYGINITAATISRWETGSIVPNAYQLLTIAQVLDVDDSLVYFTNRTDALNIEGLQKLKEYRQDLIDTGKYRPRPVQSSRRIKYVEMPVSSLPVSAGTGAFLDDDTFEMVSFPESSVPTGAEFGIRVSGDSMEPVYHDGQIVWVQPCNSLSIGEVGIFVYDGDGYIKAYDEQEPEDQDEFTDSEGCLQMQPVLVSYNEAYPPKIVSPHTDFLVVGRVLKA
jgi:phage repressor protein C with HTH and peptisase S24 domain